MPKRRGVFRVFTYGTVLVSAFFLFSFMQILLSREQTIGEKISKGLHVESRHILASRTQVSVSTQTQKEDYDAMVPNDLRLIKHVSDTLIKNLPHGDDPGYHLNQPNLVDHSRGQSRIIDKLLKEKTKGYFVDIGASDGERHSVSLFFERERDYTGLLVEPNPEKVKMQAEKGRSCSYIQACARTNITGNHQQYGNDDSPESRVEVPCLWIETILSATGRKHFDILSINQKNQEMALISTIPFDKFTFSTISIEFELLSNSDNVLRYLVSRGYSAHHQLSNHPLRKTDLVFLHTATFDKQKQ